MVNTEMNVSQTSTMDVKIVKGSSKHAQDYARLMVISSPTVFPIFFGKNVLKVLETLYQHSGQLFSKDHVWMALNENDKVVGMIQAYDWKQNEAEELNTGLILMKTIPLTMMKNIKFIMMTRNVLGIVKHGEMFVSNVAVYRQYRRKGIGRVLMTHVETEARTRGVSKMSLEVAVENNAARKLYQRLGFKTEWKTPRWQYQGKIIEYYRMIKELGP